MSSPTSQTTDAADPNRRTEVLIRRLAGLLLTLLGIHATVGPIGDVVFRVLDWVDLAIDSFAWRLMDELVDLNILTSSAGARWSQMTASFVGLAEKEQIAILAVLVVEALLVVLLLDYAWGHVKASPRPPGDAGLAPPANHFSVETQAIGLILLALCLNGMFLAAEAIEYFTFRILDGLGMFLAWSPTLSALAGLTVGVIIVGRVAPPMIQRSSKRSRQLVQRARAVRASKDTPATSSRIGGLWNQLGDTRRSRVMVLVVLPLVIISLIANGLSAIAGVVTRVGTPL